MIRPLPQLNASYGRPAGVWTDLLASLGTNPGPEALFVEMRKLTEPQAHRGRVDVIEGRFPEGMKSRCAWCGSVVEVAEGEFVELKRSAAGPSKAFRCGECSDSDAA